MDVPPQSVARDRGSAAPDADLLARTHAITSTLEAIVHWTDQPRVYPVSAADLARLGDSIDDLRSRLQQLQAEPALLTVVLMGGTGVGKSTLLNALAGADVAESSLARPTTQHPTVYHHRDVAVDRLDPALAKCRAVAHDRTELRQKLLVDTPDMDGNVTEHHQRLAEVLPLADAVLYVGSQEKYHDRVGWDLLLEHRGSRGFAFVLNKWDRCLAFEDEATGQSPLDDFRKSLAEAGFESPRVFRTCARHWVLRSSDAADEQNPNEPEPITDDFGELRNWLEAGLDERAIRDIKGRGIAGAIEEILAVLDRVVPPTWTGRTASLRQDWEAAIRESVADQTDLLIQSTDGQAAALERHFSRLGRGNFRGIFGLYLKLLDLIARARISVLPSFDTETETKISEIAARCVARVPASTRRTQQVLRQDRLLALADRRDWPIGPLATFMPGEGAEGLDEQRLRTNLGDELTALEQEFINPTGGKYAARVFVKSLCDWLPALVLVILGLKLLYDLVLLRFWGLGEVVGSVALVLLVLMGLHVLLKETIPVRWDALRGRLHTMIEDRQCEQTIPVYAGALQAFAAKVDAERAALLGPIGVLGSLRDDLRRFEQSGGQSSLFSKKEPGDHNPA